MNKIKNPVFIFLAIFSIFTYSSEMSNKEKSGFIYSNKQQAIAKINAVALYITTQELAPSVFACPDDKAFYVENLNLAIQLINDHQFKDAFDILSMLNKKFPEKTEIINSIKKHLAKIIKYFSNELSNIIDTINPDTKNDILDNLEEALKKTSRQSKSEKLIEYIKLTNKSRQKNILMECISKIIILVQENKIQEALIFLHSIKKIQPYYENIRLEIENSIELLTVLPEDKFNESLSDIVLSYLKPYQFEEILTIGNPDECPEMLALSPDDSKIAILYKNNLVRIFDTHGNELSNNIDDRNSTYDYSDSKLVWNCSIHAMLWDENNYIKLLTNEHCVLPSEYSKLCKARWIHLYPSNSNAFSTTFWETHPLIIPRSIREIHPEDIPKDLSLCTKLCPHHHNPLIWFPNLSILDSKNQIIGIRCIHTRSLIQSLEAKHNVYSFVSAWALNKKVNMLVYITPDNTVKIMSQTFE